MRYGARLFAGTFFSCFVLSGVGAVTPPAADTSLPATAKSWVDLSRYSGKENSLPVTRADFRQLVYELQDHIGASGGTARLSAAQRHPYDAVAKPGNNLGERVPLTVVHWFRSVEVAADEQRRQSLQAGAAAATDVSNVTVFAFSPLRPKTYRGCFLLFTLDQDAFFEELGASASPVTGLFFDAGDGRGWRWLAPGMDLEASYRETGTKTLKLQAYLADGGVLNATAEFQVLALETPDPTEIVLRQGCRLYVHKSGAHEGLRCPVLVVEGFDMENSMDWDELYALLNRERLMETLSGYGRDLVVLDFEDATADIIQVNAIAVMDAVSYVNSVRANMGDKFTVIGASMGGLVTRNALARMDKYPSLYGQSRVDTWVSFDSPHEGANIPLGLQQFFAFFGDVSGKSSDYSALAVAEEYRRNVDRPAAQQMLLCHHLSASALAAPSPQYRSFYQTLRSDGYPTSCRKIAIGNGSTYGVKQPFQPGALIVKWYYRSFEIDIDGQVYSLQKADSAPTAVFYGWFNPWDFFGVTEYTSSVAKYYPYALDNAAGGTRASFRELYDKLPSAFKGAGSFCNYDSHCFIPATSALGIPSEHMEKSLYANPDVAALSPFDEVYCAISNEAHIEINYRNKDWFVKAVLEGHDTDGDGIDDWQEYLSSTDYSAANPIGFDSGTTWAVSEGGASPGLHSVEIPVFGVGPAAVKVYVMPGTATARDYSVAANPMTLSWASGESGRKTVVISVVDDGQAEGEEVFYLALGDAVGGVVGKHRLCTVTVVDDDAVTVPDKGIYVTGIPQPPEGGRVSGAAYCRLGGQVRLTAKANGGWTFIRWDDGSQAATAAMDRTQAEACAENGIALRSAVFRRTAEVVPPLIAAPGAVSATVGVAFSMMMPVVSECLPKIVCAGLPPGLVLNSSGKAVTGVPSKAGAFTLGLSASNPAGAAAPVSFPFYVNPLPVWAQGTFNGYVAGGGLATMTVTALGKVTGKIAKSGMNYAFSAQSYAAGGSLEDGFTVASVAKAGKAALPLTLLVTQAEGPQALGVASGLFGAESPVILYRDAWKFEAEALAPFIGYYTATLSGSDEYGSGCLTFTVDTAGKVKVGGKLADGTAVSLGGTLLLDETGRVFVAVYFSPAAYKGGCLFGLAEFVEPAAGEVVLRLLDGLPFLWQSRSPQATASFGEGFAYAPGLAGGRYSKTGNLAAYYAGKDLTAAADTEAPTPELTVATARYDSVGWNPSGVVLTPILKSGVMTGLTAPAVGKPMDPDKDGVWDYGAANSVGLKVALTRATGIFKGSFNAWFDYPVKKHVSKSLAFEGALTPVREDASDGIEGRGYWLWPDKAVPPLPARPYAFKWSYDFLIRSE